MISAYKKFWKNYANFNGRSTRSDYWLAFLAHFLVTILGSFVLGIIAGMLDMPALIALIYVYALAIIIPSLSIAVRRLHDTNKSGWFYFVTFIPAVGSLIFLIFMCLPSVDENNNFGERV